MASWNVAPWNDAGTRRGASINKTISASSACPVRDNEVESMKHEVGSEVGSVADMNRLPQPVKNASASSVCAVRDNEVESMK
jgi:hypothetical protein